MGLLGLFKKEASSEVVDRIRNSECGQRCADTFCRFFSAGDSHIQWLMENDKMRMLTMKILKDEVQLIYIDKSQGRPTEYGYDYTAGRENLRFGAWGYEDLPNKEYVTAFIQYLYDQIKNNCPVVEVSKRDNYIYVTLAGNVKKGW